MADGELTLKLDVGTARSLREAADAAGVAVESYALDVIADALKRDRWREAARRLQEYDQTGESISVEEALTHFDQELQARLARAR